MTKTTRAQRQALKSIFDRRPIPNPELADDPYGYLTYRQFRHTVVYAFCSNAVMVPWCGMWLGIELDGYTHS